MNRNELDRVLSNSLNWFRKSSVMVPSSGIWGVAERVYLCPDKALSKRVMQSFNSFTDYGKWSVIESRRADCNFQAAYLFLLASDLKGGTNKTTAKRLLDFLYCRSGLLNRGGSNDFLDKIVGVWNWSHTQWCVNLWFDDNSWALLIPLLIAGRWPEIAEKYDMIPWAGKLAVLLAEGFDRTFKASLGKPDEDWSDPEKLWRGRPLLPHWGSLCCLALSAAYRADLPGRERFAEVIRMYHEYLANPPEGKLNVSELAYALIGSTAAYKALGDKAFLDLAVSFADRIQAKADPVTGNIPAEHYEAPTGPHLVDTIYTVNWVLLGLQNLVRLLPERKDYKKRYEQLLKLFAKIQDTSPERQFNGCWRGMYDMKTKSWGGGDCCEGGSGSIYSGWTNAPVAIAFAHEMLGMSLIG